MQYQKVLKMLENTPYLSVGLDVGADFTWMSIMLPNSTLTGKPFKIVHSDPQSRELAVTKIKEAQKAYSLESRCAFHVVDKVGNLSHLAAEAGAVVLKLLHIVIEEAAEVIPPGGGFHVVHIGIHQMAGGVHRTGDNFAQSGKASLTGAGAGNEALNLGVILHPAQLKGVGAVVEHNDVVKVGAHQLHHFLLPVGELEEVVSGVPVVPLVEGIVIGADIIGVARTAAGGIGTVDHAHHVVGQVGALAAHAGNTKISSLRFYMVAMLL